MTGLLLVIYILSSSLGLVLIKYGGKNTSINLSPNSFGIKLDYFFLLGITLFIISFLLWLVIVQKFKLTFISPVAYGLTFIVISLFSALLLNEKLTGFGLLGASFIIIGVAISCLDISKQTGPAAPAVVANQSEPISTNEPK